MPSLVSRNSPFWACVQRVSLTDHDDRTDVTPVSMHQFDPADALYRASPAIEE